MDRQPDSKTREENKIAVDSDGERQLDVLAQADKKTFEAFLEQMLSGERMEDGGAKIPETEAMAQAFDTFVWSRIKLHSKAMDLFGKLAMRIEPKEPPKKGDL